MLVPRVQGVAAIFQGGEQKKSRDVYGRPVHFIHLKKKGKGLGGDPQMFTLFCGGWGWPEITSRVGRGIVHNKNSGITNRKPQVLATFF